MASCEDAGPSSNLEDESSSDCTPAPESSRRTTHAYSQSGLSSLSYGVSVAWQHLRPFLPFFLISFMIILLIYLLQTIIYGGPFKDPLFFVKFYERWPRPTPDPQDPPSSDVFTPVSSPSGAQVLYDLLRLNKTR